MFGCFHHVLNSFRKKNSLVVFLALKLRIGGEVMGDSPKGVMGVVVK